MGEKVVEVGGYGLNAKDSAKIKKVNFQDKKQILILLDLILILKLNSQNFSIIFLYRIVDILGVAVDD